MLNSAVDSLNAKQARHPSDMLSIVLLATAVLLIVVPFETSQLIFVFAGAIAYALSQTSKSTSKSTSKPKSVATSTCKLIKNTNTQPKARPRSVRVEQQPAAEVNTNQPYTEVYKPSCQPVTPVTFSAKGWDQQAEELLENIRPTPEGDVIVQKLVQHVKQVVGTMIPEAEVVGLASGDIMRGKAFAVAVPEVDVIVTVGTAALAKSLQTAKIMRQLLDRDNLDARKVQKSAIRACTDRLVASGGFKFRRSAFRGFDPKVTLLAPSSLGFHDEAIAINFSVNSTAPIYNAALINACASIDPCIKDLLLLVKRWAKDRGVCHAAKGHLPPYQWCLLTIYFLQVRDPDGKSILPALGGQEIAPGLTVRSMTKNEREVSVKPFSPSTKVPTAGTLFKEFLQFYCNSFDWRNEAVSVRLGRRAPPSLNLPLHVVVGTEAATTHDIALTIEDPFHNGKNLSDCMTSTSLARLREELQRANDLCSKDAPLASLLELWSPPEGSGSGGGGHDAAELQEEK